MELEAFDPLVPAIVTFVVLAVLMHVVFVWKWPQSKTFWTYMDYLVIVVAGVGIVSLASDVRRHSATNFAALAGDRAEQGLRDIARAFELAQSLGWCLPDVPEYQAVCSWGPVASAAFQDVRAEVHNPVAQTFEPIDPAALPAAPPLAMQSGSPGWELDRQLRLYNEAVHDLDRLRAQSGHSGFELVLFATAPVLIAVGMAIETAKVTASARSRNG